MTTPTNEQINVDCLSEFLTTAHNIESGTLARHPQLIKLLARVHGCFVTMFSTPLSCPPVPSFLVMNAHAYFLAAIRIALAGQMPPVFPVLRAGMESVLFALIMSKDAAKLDVWSKRGKSPTARNTCSKIFTARKGLEVLNDIDPNLAEGLGFYHEQSISLGAHPNNGAVYPHIGVQDGGTHWQAEFRCLYPPDSLGVFYALSITAATGCCLLATTRHILPDHSPTRDAYTMAKEIQVELQRINDATNFAPA